MEHTITQRITTSAYTRTVRRIEHRCPICQERFIGGPLAKYCSVSCRNRANYTKAAEKWRKKRRQRYHQETANAKAQ